MSTRREVIGVLAGAAAWPIAASAQQGAIPLVGYLNAATPDGYADFCAPFAKPSRTSVIWRVRPSRLIIAGRTTNPIGSRCWQKILYAEG